jgi:hypothetical protein
MDTRLITPKLIISIVIFFTICLVGCVFDMQAKQLTAGYTPDDSVRVKLVSIENGTENMEFQAFYSFDGPSAFVFPQSTFKYLTEKEIGLTARNVFAIKCAKGSYLPVFIQDGGYASGAAEEGYEGPFLISMWLAMPNAGETNKTHIRYCTKKGTIGTIGVRIGQKGDYRLVAYDNVKFIA